VAKYYGTMPGPREPQDPEVIKLAEATWPLGTVIRDGLIVLPDGTASPITWVSARLLKPEYVVAYGNGLHTSYWSVDLGNGRRGQVVFPLNVNEGLFRYMSSGRGGIVVVEKNPGMPIDAANFVSQSGNGGYFDLELLERHAGKYVLLGIVPNTDEMIEVLFAGQPISAGFLGSYSLQ